MTKQKYIYRDVDRHGNARLYYRRGQTKIRLAGDIGSELFDAAVHRAATMHAAASVRAGKPGAFVYFVLYGQRVKIGTCQNVKARLAALSTGIPGRAKVYYVTPGNRQLEKDLHDLFAVDRISGEWFQFSKAIKDWISTDEKRRQVERQVNRP